MNEEILQIDWFDNHSVLAYGKSSIRYPPMYCELNEPINLKLSQMDACYFGIFSVIFMVKATCGNASYTFLIAIPLLHFSVKIYYPICRASHQINCTYSFDRCDKRISSHTCQKLYLIVI